MTPAAATSPDRKPDRRHDERRVGAEGPHGPERRRRDRRLTPPLRHPLPIEAAAVREAGRVLLLVALTVATVDLVDKAISPALPDYYHPRPFPVLLVMIAVTVLGSLTFPRAGSRTLAVAGGLMVGGGAANTLSLAFWGEGVPDPLVSYRLGIAFNLADVAVTAGFLLLFPALVVFVLQHRHDLEAEL